MSLRDVQQRDKQLDDIHDGLQKTLTSIKTGKSSDPKTDLAKAAAKLKEYYQGLEFIKIELRDLPENDKKLYKKKFKEHKAKYSEVLNAVKHATSMSNRDELLEDDGAADDDDRSTEEKYIREGDELLESNKDILQATLQRVQDARSLGESGIEKLKRQNEQLAGISENLDQMEDTLKVSQRLLRQMARRMLTDKYLWMLMFLVVAAIIGIILVQQF